MQQKLKRTKIVCTMGPACDNDETICEMLKAGMNVARFNFSHGSYEAVSYTHLTLPTILRV